MLQNYSNYFKSYYHNVLKERLRKKRFADRKCRLCEILMRSEHGGHNKKFYCDSCVKSGEARKHTMRLANRKFRLTHENYYKISYIKNNA